MKSFWGFDPTGGEAVTVGKRSAPYGHRTQSAGVWGQAPFLHYRMTAILALLEMAWGAFPNKITLFPHTFSLFLSFWK